MATASKATWIWYPGDFEVWLGNIFNNRRTERGVPFPPFWKQDSHWPTVEFTTTVDLAEPEDITIRAEGLSKTAKYVKSVSLNGKPLELKTITYDQIMKGGELTYEMTEKI